MLNNITIPINSNYGLSISSIDNELEFAIKCNVTRSLVDLNIPHRIMNKEYE